MCVNKRVNFTPLIQSAKLESRIQELESSSNELKKRLGEAEETRDSLQSNLDESESTCSKLQLQITQYRNVLGETVGFMLFVDSWEILI